ncbi:hypothetical protein A3Q34_16015 [Colwellia sp. PAMC 20917]|uniref:GIY-YIG nuclease family protein n=1 Tax=Colwellia sp. PAMC 20917 TaxID=1816218 RepID=UPI0008793AB7|nr:GIY-YIG nuclease family protein [Colwellia sp. PAMC 20917]AOW78217.1 hypothetical protein A3Q34_16015 [Colwellia sp. PAMC 20917]
MMKFNDLSENLKNIQDSLNSQFSELVINFLQPTKNSLINEWSDKNNLPVPVKGDGVGSKSGIYFLISENDEVLYIGKATTNNIHERIWSHLKTPEIKQNDKRVFPKNNFINRGLDEDIVSLVTNGNIYFAAVEVNPTYLCSLVEVYLHSICMKDYDRIPPLNKQIG